MSDKEDKNKENTKEEDNKAIQTKNHMPKTTYSANNIDVKALKVVIKEFKRNETSKCKDDTKIWRRACRGHKSG